MCEENNSGETTIPPELQVKVDRYIEKRFESDRKRITWGLTLGSSGLGLLLAGLSFFGFMSIESVVQSKAQAAASEFVQENYEEINNLMQHVNHHTSTSLESLHDAIADGKAASSDGESSALKARNLFDEASKKLDQVLALARDLESKKAIFDKAAKLAQEIEHDLQGNLDEISTRLADNESFRTQFSAALEQAVSDIPIGTILPWHVPSELRTKELAELSSNLPAGWRICDGANGTPDLNEKFLMGTTIPGEIATTGGSNTIKSDGDHSHGLGSSGSAGWTRLLGGEGAVSVPSDHGHSVSNAGVHDHGGDNRPSFHTVVFIIRVS